MSTDNTPFSFSEDADYLLAGIVAEHMKQTKKDEKYILGTAEAILNNTRKLYDRYIPNIHVLDIQLLSDQIIYWVQTQQTPGGSAVALDDQEKARIRNIVKKAVETGYNTVKVNTDPITVLSNTMQKALEKLYSEPVSEQDTRNKKAFEVGRRLAQEVDNLFKTGSTLGVYYPAISNENRVVFFSKSFTDFGRWIRKYIYVSIQNELKTSKSIGKISNLGHAGIRVAAPVENTDSRSEEPTKGLADFLFVNTPALTTVVLSTSRGRSSESSTQAAAQTFKISSTLVNNSIQLNKDFSVDSSGLNVLLKLLVTITLPESAIINQARGRNNEGPAVKAAGVRKATQAEIKSFLEYLFENFNFLKTPDLATSSRNMKQFLRDTIVDIIDIKKKITATLEKSTVKVSKKSRVIKVSKPKATTLPLPTAVKSTKRPQLRTKGGQFYSLFTLQNFINSMLAEQIKQNMGTGDRRDILNLRSGRFSETVKVERMSESRQGMITAFYVYMKYPYQTFEPGFAQGWPASRNPKLLISKSIRQIMAVKMNRALRAVSI